ncbi:hypothetical protein ABZ802_11125 [Streptomyces sp. NPDC047737]|uniref:hypothetical protein n=1 Tax=Streptomyces sp. NPDC047737 TaxID=3155740 RepID=UPI0033DE78C2
MNSPSQQARSPPGRAVALAPLSGRHLDHGADDFAHGGTPDRLRRRPADRVLALLALLALLTIGIGLQVIDKLVMPGTEGA